MVPPVLAIAMVMALISSGSLLLAGVITPSPLKQVFAKIAAMSAVSANEILFSFLPKLVNICLAALHNFNPSSYSVLMSSMFIEAFPCNNKSGFLRTLVIHLDTPITSFTRILPSVSKSM